MVPTATPRRSAGLTVRVLGTPIMIHWTFLVLIAFLLWVPGGWYGLMFAGIAFVGILWHEAGHAVAFSAIGRRSRIVIHGLGGFTIPDDQRPMSNLQTIGVSVAGPLAGIAIGLAALLLRLNDVGQHTLWSLRLIDGLILVNLGWGVLNLLPILPLDGGHVFQAIIDRLAPGAAHLAPYLVSIALAIPAGIIGWLYGAVLTPFLALAFILLNVQMLREHLAEVRRDRAIARVDAATALLSSPRPGDAIEALRAAISQQLPQEDFDRAAVGLAWALAWRAGPNDPGELRGLIARLAGRQDTAFLAAARADQLHLSAEARALTVRGFAGEGTAPPQWLVARLLPTRREVDEVAEWIDSLSLAERHAGLGRLVASLESSGRPADASSVRVRMARPVEVPATAGPSR